MDVIVRRYAQVFGISFLVVWVVGLRGTADAFGVLNSDHAEDTLHLLTGVLLTYVGFWASDEVLDWAVLAQGVFYIVIGVYAFISPGVFGLFPHELGAIDNWIHLGEGFLSIALVWFAGVGFRRYRDRATAAA